MVTPLPELIETDLTQQSILDILVAEVSAAVPEWTPTSADPFYAGLGAAAYRIFLLRSDFNQRALGILPQYATGQTLKDLGRLKGVSQGENETADAFRQRVLTGWEQSTLTTLPGIEAAARGASALVRDVYARHATPAWNSDNERLIELAVLSTTTTSPPGEPTSSLLTEVEDYMNNELRRFEFVRFSAIQPTLTSYDVTAELTYDAQVLTDTTAINRARASLDVFTEESRFLGVGITTDQLERALMVAGIREVDLTAPTANLAVSEITCYYPGTITLTATT